MSEEKKERPFRTLRELEEEHNDKAQSTKEGLREIWDNFKSELFSMWGLLILSALVVGILSALVR